MSSPISLVVPDAELDAGYARLAARYGMGNQYAWLARYCRQHRLRGIGIGVKDIIDTHDMPTGCGSPR